MIYGLICNGDYKTTTMVWRAYEDAYESQR